MLQLHSPPPPPPARAQVVPPQGPAPPPPRLPATRLPSSLAPLPSACSLRAFWDCSWALASCSNQSLVHRVLLWNVSLVVCHCLGRCVDITVRTIGLLLVYTYTS